MKMLKHLMYIIMWAFIIMIAMVALFYKPAHAANDYGFYYDTPATADQLKGKPLKFPDCITKEQRAYMDADDAAMALPVETQVEISYAIFDGQSAREFVESMVKIMNGPPALIGVIDVVTVMFSTKQEPLTFRFYEKGCDIGFRANASVVAYRDIRTDMGYHV
jgi:hypothetical protein